LTRIRAVASGEDLSFVDGADHFLRENDAIAFERDFECVAAKSCNWYTCWTASVACHKDTHGIIFLPIEIARRNG
jgi:hypothetical protein